MSGGLWALAWRRLLADRVAMVSLAVVAAFLLMVVLSASGLIAADWEEDWRELCAADICWRYPRWQ